MHEFDFTENNWITPSICRPLNNEQAIFSISKQVGMVIDEIDELEAAKQINNENGNNEGEAVVKKRSIKRKKILIDYEHNLIRYEDYGTNEIKIYDVKNKILFNLTENGYCDSHYNADISGDINPKLLQTLGYILQNGPKEYYSVGRQVVRNVLTNVYRKKTVNDEGFNTATLYLQQTQSEKNRESFTHDPVQIRIEEYTLGGKKPKSSLLFNFYDFEKIKNDDDLADTFDVSQCVDKSMTDEFSLVGSKGNCFT